MEMSERLASRPGRCTNKKEHRYRLNRRLGRTQSRSGSLLKTNLLPLPGSEPLTVAIRYADHATYPPPPANNEVVQYSFVFGGLVADWSLWLSFCVCVFVHVSCPYDCTHCDRLSWMCVIAPKAKVITRAVTMLWNMTGSVRVTGRRGAFASPSFQWKRNSALFCWDTSVCQQRNNTVCWTEIL
jgi:hypothetical protein